MPPISIPPSGIVSGSEPEEKPSPDTVMAVPVDGLQVEMIGPPTSTELWNNCCKFVLVSVTAVTGDDAIV